MDEIYQGSISAPKLGVPTRFASNLREGSTIVLALWIRKETAQPLSQVTMMVLFEPDL